MRAVARRPLRLAALALACALPLLAHAQAPSAQQVQQLREMFGFNAALNQAVDEQLKEFPAAAGLSQAQRRCVGEVVKPLIDSKLQDAIGVLFGDSDTAAQWLEFQRTSGGARMMEFVRQGVRAQLDKTQAPTPDQAFEGMGQAELGDVMAFMMSPAANVLQRDFPDMDMSDVDKAAFAGQVRDTCGVDGFDA